MTSRELSHVGEYLNKGTLVVTDICKIVLSDILRRYIQGKNKIYQIGRYH